MFDFLTGLKVSTVMSIVDQIFKLLPTNMVQEFIQKLSAYAEESILGSASTVDDERILPILKRMNAVVDMPGNGAVVSALIQFMLNELPELIFDTVVDMLFDWIEDTIEESENEYDDLLLPVIDVARAVLGVEDND